MSTNVMSHKLYDSNKPKSGSKFRSEYLAREEQVSSNEYQYDF